MVETPPRYSADLTGNPTNWPLVPRDSLLVRFFYIDREKLDEHYVSVPEQGAGKLIPEGDLKPGHLFTVGRSEDWAGGSSGGKKSTRSRATVR